MIVEIWLLQGLNDVFEINFNLQYFKLNYNVTYGLITIKMQ